MERNVPFSLHFWLFWNNMPLLVDLWNKLMFEGRTCDLNKKHDPLWPLDLRVLSSRARYIFLSSPELLIIFNNTIISEAIMLFHGCWRFFFYCLFHFSSIEILPCSKKRRPVSKIPTGLYTLQIDWAGAASVAEGWGHMPPFFSPPPPPHSRPMRSTPAHIKPFLINYSIPTSAIRSFRIG